MKKKFVKLITVIFLACAILSGCGSSDYNTADEYGEAAPEDRAYDDSGFGEEMDMDGAPKEESMENQSQVNEENIIDDGRKIIKTYYFDLETKEFEKTNTAINNKVQAVGGYIENSNISGNSIYQEYEHDSYRYASFTLRIPRDKVDEFIGQLGDVGNVRNSSNESQDKTYEYFDTEAHLKSLEIQEERLLTLLQKSGELSDIIEIERELADVRYQIESLTGTLRKWDDLVNYSTINIEVREVKEITPETPEDFLGQVREGFSNSLHSLYKLCKNLIYVLIVGIPYIVVLAIIVAIVGAIRKKTNKGNRDNRKFWFRKKKKDNDEEK
ncbi:DUF4349 domain-containing protein [Clostridium sp. DL1XJH146]